MAKLKSGDVYEVPVLAQRAFMQYIRKLERYGPLLRVFTTLHDERPSSVDTMVAGASFRIFYAVSGALRAPQLIDLVGNVAVREEDRSPVKFCSGQERGPWQLYVEGEGSRLVQHVSAEEQAWPTRYYTMSHQGLLRLILEANNLSVEPDQLAVMGLDVIPSDHLLFFCYFQTKSATSRMADELSRHKTLSTMAHVVRKAEKGWLLRLNGKTTAPLEEVDDYLDKLVVVFGGKYDGYEAPA